MEVLLHLRAQRSLVVLRGVTLLLALAALPGCGALPGAGSAGRRLRADAWVVFTSPVGIPSMAARDAWGWAEHPAARAGLLPVSVPVELLRHTGLMALHLVDLTAAPLHLFNDLEAPRIYQRDTFPMVRDDTAPLGPEAADVGLWAGATWGGAALTWWFFGVYVPALFEIP